MSISEICRTDDKAFITESLVKYGGVGSYSNTQETKVQR